VTNGTVDITDATSDGHQLVLAGRFGRPAASFICFDTDDPSCGNSPSTSWVVENPNNEGMVLAYDDDGTSLSPRWVTLMESVAVSDRLAGIGRATTGTLWAAGFGESSGGGTTKVERRFSVDTTPTPSGCSSGHPGGGMEKPRAASVVALDPSGACLGATYYGAGSEVRKVLGGTPWMAGLATTAMPDSLELFALEPPGSNETLGLLLSPLVEGDSITESGGLFGGPASVRVEDLALLPIDRLVVAGTMEGRFLNLVCSTAQAPGGIDFFVGAIDPSRLLP
jgi:hypothetical protein